MIRFFFMLATAAALLLGGCADSLEVREAATADQAGNVPDPTGHIPRQLERNPLGEGAPAF